LRPDAFRPAVQHFSLNALAEPVRWRHTSLVAAVLSLSAHASLWAEVRSCQTVRFAGTVVQGQAFERQVGSGIVFRLAPNLDPTISGWTIEMRSQGSPEKDFLWVATPPYRFSHPRYLDTSYGYTAAQAVAWSVRDFNFALNEADHDRLLEAVRKVLWPSGLSEAESEQGRRLVEETPRGHGMLRIRDARIGGEEENDGRGWIEHLSFEVELCFPLPPESEADIHRADFVAALEQKFLRDHPDYLNVEEASEICGHPLVASLHVEFAELDDKPGEEAVVEAASCFAGTGGIDLPAVFTLRDGGALVELSVQRPGYESEAGRPLWVNLRGKMDLAVEGGALVEFYPIYADGDANCCPTAGQRKFVYRWDGETFVLREVRDLPPQQE
jgi:hypothetical protein